MPGHIVTSYDTDLEDLRRSISEMGGVAEKMTGEATLALARQDEALAQTVIIADKRLDTLQREIEEKAVLLIARRQPLAVDLRETISAIRVSGDLERIGDLAKNVAKRVTAIADQSPAQKIVLGVRHMSDLAEGSSRTCSTPMPAVTPRRRMTCGSATAKSTPSTIPCSANS